MIVVPKPNPLNINRLGHAHSHHYSVPFVPAPSMGPSTTAPPALVGAQKRAGRSVPVPPKSPANRHYHSNSRSETMTSFRYPTQTPNSQYRQPQRGTVKNQFGYDSSYRFVVGAGVGPEFEMALDYSDMSPTSSPSPSPSPSSASSTKSRTSSPPYLYPINTGTQHVHASSYPFTGVNLFSTSFPNTPGPAPILMHARAPSAPVIGHSRSGSGSYSPTPSALERDRYASSTWQNSPPAASLPKPKFMLEEDVFN